jgi:hemolysin D
VVTPAQQLMVVVPKEPGLEIEATLENKDVGFVHKGQDVAVKVEAFTYTRYGLLRGVVTNLSHDAVATSDSNADGRESRTDVASSEDDEKERQSREPTYVAHIALEATGIQTENGFSPAALCRLLPRMRFDRRTVRRG